MARGPTSLLLYIFNLMKPTKLIFASTAAAAMCLSATAHAYAQNFQKTSPNRSQIKKSGYYNLLDKSRMSSLGAFSKYDSSKLKKITQKAKADRKFRSKLAKNPGAIAKHYGLSKQAANFLTTKVRAEDLGRGTTVQSGCVCTHCCVTTINTKPGQERAQQRGRLEYKNRSTGSIRNIR